MGEWKIAIDRPPGFTWCSGERVKKKSGSDFRGEIVGFYSSVLTHEGYAIESAYHPGTIQIFPFKALELWDGR